MSASLFLAPCVGDEANKAFKSTVVDPVSRNEYKKYTDRDYGSAVSIWGLNAERYFKRMYEGDYILFYTVSGEYTHSAQVAGIEQNPDLGDELYGNHKVKYIIYIKNLSEIDVSMETVHDHLGYDRNYYPRTLTKVSEDSAETIRDEFGSIAEYIESLEEHDDFLTEFTGEEEKKANKLLNIANQEPSIGSDDWVPWDNESDSGERKRKLRWGRILGKVVSKLYENKCAICGSAREHPSGRFNENDYINITGRKGKTGSFDVRAHVVVCKLHKWAVRAGWISFTNDYEVMVKEASNREGYDEFKQLEGKKINIPDKKQLRPHPAYLDIHRDKHGFPPPDQLTLDDL